MNQTVLGRRQFSVGMGAVALGGFGLPDAAYRAAIAANFAGKEKVAAQNEAVFALAKQWGEAHRA